MKNTPEFIKLFKSETKNTINLLVTAKASMAVHS